LSSATASGNQSPAENVGQAHGVQANGAGPDRLIPVINRLQGHSGTQQRSSPRNPPTVPAVPRAEEQNTWPAGWQLGATLLGGAVIPLCHFPPVPCSTIKKFADCPGSVPGKEIGAVPRCWTAAELAPSLALWPIHGFPGTSSRPARPRCDSVPGRLDRFGSQLIWGTCLHWLVAMVISSRWLFEQRPVASGCTCARLQYR
jgi:hypothetical protein